MPWIVVNMGCEMVFILAQRLRAQEVPASRACRVLCDIVGTLLDRHFVAEKLFVPQEMYSLSSTRKIFDRLAHSSIMRLNESRCARRAWRSMRRHLRPCMRAGCPEGAEQLCSLTPGVCVQ